VTTGEKIRRVRKLLSGDVNQSDMDKALGFPEGRTSTYERDRAKPSPDYLAAMNRKYGIPAAYILDPTDNFPPNHPLVQAGNANQRYGDEGVILEPIENNELSLTGEPLLLALYGDVPAGEWDESDADPEWIEVERDIYDLRRFARRISGDSMSPALRSGDMAIFHPSTQPRDNVIVLAQNPEGKKTVKTCRYRDEEWVLEPVNKGISTYNLREWTLLAFLVVVKRTGNKGLEVRYRCDVGLQPEMLPTD
jgi:transcriptional regulator with XRE-family HTH domain